MGDVLDLLQVLIGAVALFVSILDSKREAPPVEANGKPDQNKE